MMTSERMNWYARLGALGVSVASGMIGAAGLTRGTFAHPPDQHGRHAGHDEHHEHAAAANSRVWTRTDSDQVVRGSFFAWREAGGTVTVSIERDDGSVVSLPLSSLSAGDQAVAKARIADIKANNQVRRADGQSIPSASGGEAERAASEPAQAGVFRVFEPYVTTRWDAQWLMVESDGLPHVPGSKDPSAYTHTMMVGITAWQQQVPLPQNYRGDNAWRIPLKPELAERPVKAKEQLFRGAIALAANGVPIFNPIKNDGKTDTFLAGELDEFGGHCGRADDYHYHIAPTHLQTLVGPGKPIAYALDGFAIYGEFDPSAKGDAKGACPLGASTALDEFNGHFAPAPAGAPVGTNGEYHYHASKKYPYVNGGMRGKVTVREDQIEPQPRATPVRDWLQPLRGAKITGFKSVGPKAWSLVYTLSGKACTINYRIEGAGAEAKYQFEFIGPDGAARTATYGAGEGRRAPGRRGEQAQPGENDRPRGDRPRGRRGENGEGAGQGRPQDQGQGPREGQGQGPAQGQARLPWILAHAQEIDTNADGRITRDEVLTQAKAAFEAYDKNRNGTLERAEYDRASGARPPRLPMGGFVDVHAREIDANGDGVITLAELTTLAGEMFDKSDTNHDGVLEKDELTSRANGQPGDVQRDGRRGGGGGGGRDRGLLARLNEFQTDVPEHEYNVVLVRPTPHSMTASVMNAGKEVIEAYVEYQGGVVADSPARFGARTPVQTLEPGKPANFVLDRLKAGERCAYRLRTRAAGAARGAADFKAGESSTFRTRPLAGSAFTFTITADSHLDANVTPAVYARTLANALSDRPDLHIDLGDTFMVDKRGTFSDAGPQYLAQRYYFGLIGRAAPVFLVLGNHDGEMGYAMRGDDSMAAWSYQRRTTFFPPPLTLEQRDEVGTYTGRTQLAGGQSSNYYAFSWGDATFIVLDPFAFTTERPRGPGGGGDRAKGQSSRESDTANTDDNWSRTLGKEQYDWLDRTLKASRSKYIFVFVHHLVGGLGKAARGGTESSTMFEWGGANADGSPGFATHRAGWEMPIHDLLITHGVSAVFHGHDHLYVRGERGGLVYQCVPQPGNVSGGTRSAGEYGYASGVILPSPGYLRVRVHDERATVQCVRSALGDGAPGQRQRGRGGDRGGGESNRGENNGGENNGDVVHEYTITARKQADQP